MECQPLDVAEPSPSSATPSEEPSEPSEPVRMKKPRAPRKKKLATNDATSEASKDEAVPQPLLDPLFWAALLNTHNRMLKSKKQEQYTNFRLT